MFYVWGWFAVAMHRPSTFEAMKTCLSWSSLVKSKQRDLKVVHCNVIIAPVPN